MPVLHFHYLISGQILKHLPRNKFTRYLVLIVCRSISSTWLCFWIEGIAIYTRIRHRSSCRSRVFVKIVYQIISDVMLSTVNIVRRYSVYLIIFYTLFTWIWPTSILGVRAIASRGRRGLKSPCAMGNLLKQVNLSWIRQFNRAFSLLSIADVGFNWHLAHNFKTRDCPRLSTLEGLTFRILSPFS